MKEKFPVKGRQDKDNEGFPMAHFQAEDIDSAIQYVYDTYKIQINRQLLRAIAETAHENMRKNIPFKPACSYALKEHLRQYPNESWAAYSAGLKKAFAEHNARIRAENQQPHVTETPPDNIKPDSH
ncbi:MAG: hypothetical protein B7X04_00830 [Parcubacteria group bacterium 21-54-25]|nr:MAG: hypothetical protein B7X04_00830 [Parcubacteria group bacterium 21-54-25]HQU07946.1 hypothetical protein [Candidatus Paceibacterota bacterium]